VDHAVVGEHGANPADPVLALGGDQVRVIEPEPAKSRRSRGRDPFRQR
jgi:hypothetical protein